MAKNYDIKTVSKLINTQSSHIPIGSSVAAGMTRFVTFLRIEPIDGNGDEGSKVYFCSCAASDSASNPTAASTLQKIVMHIQSSVSRENKDITVPKQPNTEHPLFTVAASAWLTATLGSLVGTSYPVSVFAQYFDE